MERIQFGKETKLEIFANTCPGYNTSRGHYHEYGCPLESCPKCHSRLLACTCKVLGVVDSMKMAKAVSTNITDKTEGGYLVSAEGIAPHLNKTVDEAQDILEELHTEAVYPDWHKIASSNH